MAPGIDSRGTHEHRRTERFPFRVPLAVKHGGELRELYTKNVSEDGIFISTDDPPALRQLIQVQLLLPPQDTPFDSHGMSVFVRKPGPSVEHPGFGVQFYAQVERERRKWLDFIRHIKSADCVLPEQAVDPVRRRYPRVKARFEVQSKEMDDKNFTNDVSLGGLFVETSARIPVGTSVALTIFHPDASEGFPLRCVVRRQSPTGLGLEFERMEGKQRLDLEAFLQRSVEALAELQEFPIEVELSADFGA